MLDDAASIRLWTRRLLLLAGAIWLMAAIRSAFWIMPTMGFGGGPVNLVAAGVGYEGGVVLTLFFLFLVPFYLAWKFLFRQPRETGLLLVNFALVLIAAYRLFR